jgi:hypothetical protein
MAIDNSTKGVIKEWNGVSWRSLPTSSRWLDSVACAARHRCVAVGASEALTWNGRVWSKAPLSRQLQRSDFISVACAGPADCMAVGIYTPSGGGLQQPIAMRWNGAKWHQVAASPGAGALSGDGPGRYVAVGADASFFWNGSSWLRVALPGSIELQGISCARSFCLAVGSSSEFAWNGSKWSTLPATGFSNAGVWCTGRDACMDVGGGLASYWNGRGWTPMRLSVINRLRAVSCTRPGNCMALGETNNLRLAPLGQAPAWLAERWSGSAWQNIPGPASGLSAFQGSNLDCAPGTCPAVSCTTTRFCMALDVNANNPAAQRWNGSEWIATNLSADLGYQIIQDLSCASSGSCLAVGALSQADARAWAWDGTSWHATASPGISGQDTALQSVSCASATMCMAVGYEFTPPCDTTPCTIHLLAEQWNGSTWSVTGTPALGTGTVYELPSSLISCPSTTFCMEVTGPSARSWDGHTWHKRAAPSRYIAPDLSCGSASSCVVVGNLGPVSGTPFGETGAAQAWNGTAWRTTRLASAGLLHAVSCPQPDQCIAVGATLYDQAMAQSWNGTAWKLLSPANP